MVSWAIVFEFEKCRLVFGGGAVDSWELESIHTYIQTKNWQITSDGLKTTQHWLNLWNFSHWVNAWYNNSLAGETTLPINPHKIFKNDSNGYAYYFKKCYYFNI